MNASARPTSALVPCCCAPSECRFVKVAESGLKSPVEMDRLARAGFSAYLIGESLITADDPAAKLQELVG